MLPSGINVLRNFAALLRAFRTSRSGHVAVVFAVTATPILGSIGTAVDLTRADQVRAAMQIALDATAQDLAGAAGTLNANELTRRANDLFRNRFGRFDAYDVSVTPRYAAFESGFTFTMSGSAMVQSKFVRLFGVPDFAVTGASEIIGGIKTIEVAVAD